MTNTFKLESSLETVAVLVFVYFFLSFLYFLSYTVDTNRMGVAMLLASYMV
jgi:hypothetical protein